MEKEYDVLEYAKSLNIDLPPLEKFYNLSEIFKINPRREKIFSTPNYQRGVLLYALVAKYKPKTVLEIGTAEGFSTMCMAWAMDDFGIDGKIITVDPKPFDIPVKRLIDFDLTMPKEFVLMSTKSLWEKFAKPSWLTKISMMTCYSFELLKKEIPEINFCYIDGHHRKQAVLCDFNIFIQNAAKHFLCLFDDYFPNSEVKDAIDQEIAPYFDMQLLKTDFKKQKEENGEAAKEMHMCLIDSSKLKTSIDSVFTNQHSTKMIMNYKKTMNRWLLKKKLGRIFQVLTSK
jgi:hypothetical protein